MSVADHGVRTPAYGILGEAPYGWTGTPEYGAVPTGQIYERIDWSTFSRQSNGEDIKPTSGRLSNPPFIGASQIVGPEGPPEWMRRAGGGINRVLRGFLRRQEVDPADNKSLVRLMFMWNPDEIKRQYISAMDTNVADISNITGQNPADSPYAYAAVNATFSLFFDRQAEVATIKDHPGVLVDLQAFDALAGNVASTGTKQYTYDTAAGEGPEGTGVGGGRGGGGGGSLGGDGGSGGITPTDVPVDPGEANVGMSVPAGVTPNMALTPTFVTAVFAPTLSFYGVLLGAEVTFTKFSSRMVPTAMMLQLTMNLVAVGTLKPQSTLPAAATGAVGVQAGGAAPDLSTPPTPDKVDGVNAQGPKSAHDWGMTLLGTPYDRTMKKRMDGPPCNTKPTWSDCSAFVYRCYLAIKWTKLLGLGDNCGGAPDTAEWQRIITSRSDVWEWKDLAPGKASAVWMTQLLNQCRAGDIFVRGRTGVTARGGSNGHIIMFSGVDKMGDVVTPGSYVILHSTAGGTCSVQRSPGKNASYFQDYNVWARPRPFGKANQQSSASW